MQLSSKLYFFWILVVCSLISCEDEFDPTISVPPAKPAVTCFLTNTKNEILLYYNTPASVNEHDELGIISDATVYISNGTITMQMPFDSVNGVYSIDTINVPVQKGSNYELHILNQDGSEMKAKSSVPYYPAPDITFSATYHGSDYSYNITINDSLIGERYYLLHLINMTQCHTIGCNDTDFVILKSFPVFINQDIMNYSLLINFTLPFGISTTLGHSYGLTVEAFAINQDMYRYFNSVNANLASSSSSYSSPSPVYNSFILGNGIFGPIIGK